ncbi:MAG: 2-phospho-L-lactate transferase CofD family protein [Acidimicrobiales bacterium]
MDTVWHRCGPVSTYTSSIVGIVSVADDGGSSGKLRSRPRPSGPGRPSSLLSALATEDSLLARSLEYRFNRGTLEGHPIGNLLIAGLAEATGDFQAAITEVARLIGAMGEIFRRRLAR